VTPINRYTLKFGLTCIGLLFAFTCGMMVWNAQGQAPFVAGVMTQDITGKTIIKPIGRGLYLDPATGTIRTLSWGGLFSTTPNTLWITPVAGGNAAPVRVDTTTLQIVPDPTIPNGMMLSIIPKNSVPEEVPAGTLDGVNVVFTLANIPKTIQLYRNGIRLKNGLDYVLTGQTLTFQAGAIPQAGDLLIADYTW
jgi:hypothetical protein